MDFIGANYLNQNIACLKNCGRLLLVALLGGAKTEINLTPILRKRLQLKGMNLRHRSLTEKRILVKDFLCHWMQPLSRGHIKPVIDRVFKMQEAAKAHAHMEANANIGKIILLMD